MIARARWEFTKFSLAKDSSILSAPRSQVIFQANDLGDQKTGNVRQFNF